MRAHCLTASCFMPGLIVITEGDRSATTLLLPEEY